MSAVKGQFSADWVPWGGLIVLQTFGLLVMSTPSGWPETLLQETTKSRTNNETETIFFMMEQLSAKTVNVQWLYLRNVGGLFYSICSSYHGCGLRSLNEPGLVSSHLKLKSYLIMWSEIPVSCWNRSPRFTFYNFHLSSRTLQLLNYMALALATKPSESQ